MGAVPWYRTTVRWGQTNLTEVDPTRYDHEFWRLHWKKTNIQGVIVNAGGIVAYYPSKYPLHHRAETLGDRDLFGEIVTVAREEGLSIIARMDSNRVAVDFFHAHPEWVCRDENGDPRMQADKYITCINSPYYSEYLPGVMREIIDRNQPDGFADNSWAGLPRDKICYCIHCREQFGASGNDLPKAHDWDDPSYRAWIAWNYRRRTELWDANNAVTMAAGGEHCRWMGMLSGDLLNNCNRFIDLRAILKRSEIVMLDHQRRSPEDGFEQNAEAGRRLHELLGWEKLIPESMPQYQLGRPAFRLASMPAAEVRLWSSSGFAGGIQPWWHHISASHEDRRQYQTAAPIFAWHKANEDILLNRRPTARIGVVWSQANHDLHGRDRGAEITLGPYRGTVRALARGGLDWLPVEVSDIAAAVERFDVLVLPNIAILSDQDVSAIRTFVEHGGSLVMTGETGCFDAAGQRRDRPALAGMFGLEPQAGGDLGDIGVPDPNIEVPLRHSYLRLSPENRAAFYGPVDKTATADRAYRHPVLNGLDSTDIVPFGGFLPRMRALPETEVLATWVPAFPIYPPETSWMRQPRSDIPALTVCEKGASRLVAVLADLDRCYAREESFEHAQILSNAVTWCLGDRPHITVSGAGGLLSVAGYAQGERRIVHLNSRLVTSPTPGRQEVLVPIGPARLCVPWTGPGKVTLRVSGGEPAVEQEDDRIVVTVPAVSDHEVVVIEPAPQ
ncbi:beta-galactosidase trimerization domain-containing protein [Frigidibacter sp. ROC022]|uniref:beta-galactosidase trimerization domain-containing protein n=1 Tax=Frigidibacter sp. ROC022 TaxID=2971796 RepID=UPI00215A477A|nr:beta-galactosidase trimerization domain-containing protein [Frigidibacter sp. ROC022]MCR8724610.1 beta-galactosidase trimerization domain-containing protein [Frigidibacter sp. ROC022]